MQLKSNKQVLLDFSELNASIHPDDSTWTIDSDKLCLTLEKASAVTWHFLSPLEEEADA